MAAWATWTRLRRRGASRRWWPLHAGRCRRHAEQRDRIAAIMKAAANDLQASRKQHMQARRQSMQLLTAPTIDRAQLEKLRVEQMQLGDATSRRMLQAMMDSAEVLTPSSAPSWPSAGSGGCRRRTKLVTSPAAAPEPPDPAAPSASRHSPAAAAPPSHAVNLPDAAAADDRRRRAPRRDGARLPRRVGLRRRCGRRRGERHRRRCGRIRAELLILDLMLPDGDGLDVCRKLARRRRRHPDPDADGEGRSDRSRDRTGNRRR